MRLYSLLVTFILLPVYLLLPGSGRALETTPTEARALAAAQADHAAYTLPAARLPAAEALAHSGMLLHGLGLLLPVAILWGLLHLGAAARMRDVAVHLSKRRWMQGFLYSLALLLAFSVLSLPLDLYARHRLLVYGLSVQSFASWASDLGVTFLLTLVLGWLGVLLLFWLFRRLPQRWWVALWGAFCVLTVIGFFVTPYVIDPLFNHFEPLANTNPALVTQLEKVVARGGINIRPDAPMST